MSSINKSPSKNTVLEATKTGDKSSRSQISNPSASLNISAPQSTSNKSQQMFVPAISIYGKINTVLTNDPEGYYNKDSEKVYELLSSSLEVYLRDIIKKMYENRKNRLNRVTKVVNGKPVTMSKINKVIETINKEERKLELQRVRSRKENGIVIEEEEEGKDVEETGEKSGQKKDGKTDALNSLSSASGGASSSDLGATTKKGAAASENNTTANLFSGGMNKKYSWLSGSSSSTNLKSSNAANSIASLSGNPFKANENAPVQTDIRNHIIKEERNLVMRDLIKVLEWELQTNSKRYSNKDIQEILAKGYARLRD